jgi:uncharacterized damage-inducible protein DinB
MAATKSTSIGERDELLQMLAEQRNTFLIALRGIGTAQASARTTASDLTLGGLLKHLLRGETVWTQIITAGDGALPEGMLDLEQYYFRDDDALAVLLDEYTAATCKTDAAIAALPDLDRMVPLPQMPWAPPGTIYWSIRRILLHLLRETAQHAGHADIIRESLDGASTTAQLGT